MKITIEISDDLFARVKQLARKEKTTFRALTEAGLRMVLEEKQSKTSKWRRKHVTFRGDGSSPSRIKGKLPPLVTSGGDGLTDEFKNAGWDKIRDEIYRGHGA